MAMILVLRKLAEVPPFIADGTLALQVLDQIGEQNLLATRHLGDVLLHLPPEEHAPVVPTLPCHKVSFFATMITARITTRVTF
jgi:hypothetical protein